MGNGIKKRLGGLVSFLVILLLGVVFVIPFYMVLVNSFKTGEEAAVFGLSLPDQWVFNNFTNVIRLGNLNVAFFNSIVITVISVILTILLASVTAFILERRRDGFTKTINLLVLIGLVIPPSMVILFFTLKLLGLIGTRPGIILIYIGTLSPLAVYIFYEYIKGISRDFDFAAVIDGCDGIQLFYRIIFPMLLPATSTVSIFDFIMIWNDFITPMYMLSGGNKATLPLTLYLFYGQYRILWNLVFADIVLASVPLVIVYFFAQKYIISGLTEGAIKG